MANIGEAGGGKVGAGVAGVVGCSDENINHYK